MAVCSLCHYLVYFVGVILTPLLSDFWTNKFCGKKLSVWHLFGVKHDLFKGISLRYVLEGFASLIVFLLFVLVIVKRTSCPPSFLLVFLFYPKKKKKDALHSRLQFKWHVT